MANSTFFLTGIDGLRDPARSTRWRVLLPGDIFKETGYSNTNGGKDRNLFETNSAEEFALLIKKCTIPEITLETKDHEYMGFKSQYVTNAKIDADFPLEAIMLEDMRAYEALMAWHQNCINTGLLVSPEATGDTADGDDRTTTLSGIDLGLGVHKEAGKGETPVHTVKNSGIKIQMYNWFKTEEVILEIRLINAIPKRVGGFSLDYGPSGNLIKFPFTLHADRWTIRIPKEE